MDASDRIHHRVSEKILALLGNSKLLKVRKGYNLLVMVGLNIHIINAVKMFCQSKRNLIKYILYRVHVFLPASLKSRSISTLNEIFYYIYPYDINFRIAMLPPK